MELTTLNRRIKSLTNKTAKWRDEVQFCLVGCMYQAITHSNVDPCTKIIGALKGADAKAVIHWIEAHGPAIWQKGTESFRFNKSFVGEYDAAALLGAAWWELATKPKNISSSIDVLQSVRDLISRVEREIALGKKTVEHQEVLEGLKALAAENGEFKREAFVA